MNTILAVVIITSIILSFPVSFILFAVNKVMKSATRLLAVAFFAISTYALSHFLFLTELILRWPLYYRLVVPLYYLIPPCIYLYIRQILRLNPDHIKYIWVHFLPAIITLIDIIPWLSAGTQARYNAVSLIVVHHASIFEVAPGYIPIWIHFVARPLLGLLYLFFQCRYLFKVKEVHSARFQSDQYTSVYRWTIILSVIESIMYFSLSGFSIMLLLNLDDMVFIRTIVYAPAFIMSISFIAAAFYLYLTPHLLYGYEFAAYRIFKETDYNRIISYQPKSLIIESQLNYPHGRSHEPKSIPENEYSLEEGASQPQSYSSESIEEYRKCLEKDIKQLQLFKRQGLTVYQVTKMCDIPARALSFILSTIYKKRFNDFINEYRVDYIVKRLYADDWRELTLEGLAFEAGFSSRTTFFLAFKKVHNMSPSQFVSRIEKELYRGA